MSLTPIKIRIIGNSGDVPDEILFDGTETWTMNFFNEVYPNLKPQRCYQIHSKSVLFGNPDITDERMKRWKEACKDTLVIVGDDYDIKGSVSFDFENAFKEYDSTWFGSCLSYAFYDALTEGVTDIEIEGISLMGDAYNYQAPSYIKWVDLLRPKGVNITHKYETVIRKNIMHWDGITEVGLDYGRDIKRLRPRIEICTDFNIDVNSMVML